MEAQRQRLSSVVAADLLPCLEGVEMGACGKVNVYLIDGTTIRTEQRTDIPRNTPITQIDLLDLCNFSSSDGVIRSVPLSDKCVGETEEWRRARELHSSDHSVPFPWQRAEELHPCASEQQCGTGTM